MQSLIVEVAGSVADALADALLAHGAVATSIEDAHAGTPHERAVFAGPDQQPAAWSLARLSVLLAGDADPALLLADAARAAGLEAAPAFAVEAVAERDWVQHTQAQFAPLQVTARLWIVPSWHEPPDRTAINVVVD